MEPIHIRKKRPVKQRNRIAIATVFLLLILTTAFLISKSLEKKSFSVVKDNQDSSLTLIDYQESEISTLTVSPRRSNDYTLNLQNDQIQLASDPEYPLRNDTVRILFQYAAHLNADEVVLDLNEHTEHQLSDYGLKPAVCSISVNLKNNKTYSIFIGNRVPMDEIRYYATITGDTHIYTVTSDVMDALNVPFYALHPVTRPVIKADLIDKFSVKGDVLFSAEKTDFGWKMNSPVDYLLSENAINNLLNSFENIRFSTWAASDGPESRRIYGFDEPRKTLNIEFARSILSVPDETGEEQRFDIPESAVTIIQGNSYSDTADYYLYNNDIMTGTVLSFSFLKSFDWKNYVRLNPFIYGLNNLSSFVFIKDSQNISYIISYIERIKPNNEFETDDSGNILYDMRVLKNGLITDTIAFSGYYQKLQELEILDFLESPWFPNINDVPEITIKLVSENAKSSFEISLYPKDASSDYLVLNGVCLFTVKKNWMNEIIKLP